VVLSITAADSSVTKRQDTDGSEKFTYLHLASWGPRWHIS